MDNIFSLPTTPSILYLKRFEHRGHTGVQANPAHQFLHSQFLGMDNISTHSAPVCRVVKDLYLSRAGEPCECTLGQSLRIQNISTWCVQAGRLLGWHMRRHL